MKLYDFIENFIARNTLVRLWKSLDADFPDRDKEKLCHVLMEWEVQEIELLKDIEVIHITDIVCIHDAEAVNIVLDTDITREECEQAIKEYNTLKKSIRENQMIC